MPIHAAAAAYFAYWRVTPISKYVCHSQTLTVWSCEHSIESWQHILSVFDLLVMHEHSQWCPQKSECDTCMHISSLYDCRLRNVVLLICTILNKQRTQVYPVSLYLCPLNWEEWSLSGNSDGWRKCLGSSEVCVFALFIVTFLLWVKNWWSFSLKCQIRERSGVEKIMKLVLQNRSEY